MGKASVVLESGEDAEIRQAIIHDFGSSERVPTRALSVGLQTLLEARELLVLATGAVKALAMRESSGYTLRSATTCATGRGSECSGANFG